MSKNVMLVYGIGIGDHHPNGRVRTSTLSKTIFTFLTVTVVGDGEF